MTQTRESLNTHLNLDLLQASIQQLDENTLENVAELVFFLDHAFSLSEWDGEFEEVSIKALHALYMAGNLSQIYHTAHGQMYPPQLDKEGELVQRQSDFVEKYYQVFLDTPKGTQALESLVENLEQPFDDEDRDKNALYRVKPIIYEVLYPQRFGQLWQQYTNQGHTSFMAWTAAYITLQDEVEGRQSRSVVHDAAMEYIEQLGAKELGIEAQFVQIGVSRNIAIQLAFGALWHEDDAINDALETIPSSITRTKATAVIQQLADTTSALFNRIQVEMSPQTMLAVAQLINGIAALKQLEESDGRNQALATAHYDLAVTTGLLGEKPPDDPYQLTDLHYATLNHFIRIFCETERGEAAFMELKHQQQNPTQISGNLLNPPQEPGVNQKLFTPIPEPEVHSIAIEDMPMLQPPEIRAVLEAPQSTLNYIAKQIAKIDTVFRESQLCINDCLWRIGSSLNIINEIEAPSPEDLTDTDFHIITIAIDFFCMKNDDLIEPYRKKYRSSSVISVPGKVIDEIYELLTEDEAEEEPSVQYFRLPDGQVVKMYETAPGHYSMSLNQGMVEYNPINQYISAGWEPIDNPGYVGMSPAH